MSSWPVLVYLMREAIRDAIREAIGKRSEAIRGDRRQPKAIRGKKVWRLLV